MNGIERVAQLITPNGGDWLVTLFLHDGRSMTRRITPAYGDEAYALRVALNAQCLQPSQIKDVYIRHVGDEKKIELVDDGFTDLLKRAQR